ncbi:hypothetical protein BJP34_33440 [Moorena producens PAL-8-15-08-1]|uniref:Uncharacterized protein n=1 Tax=Moorena producens PAL-8-15-08-1 TaxID=1458985 RepID=A0A1D8U1I6_9CYAN|nr:hypothetical protein [Moorena producens]AOX03683.1 hypothetical protein BJP34_33440 [Moorena producens PAL-8-15-08-1]
MSTPLLFIQRFSNASLVQGTRKEFDAIAQSGAEAFGHAARTPIAFGAAEAFGHAARKPMKRSFRAYAIANKILDPIPAVTKFCVARKD